MSDEFEFYFYEPRRRNPRTYKAYCPLITAATQNDPEDTSRNRDANVIFLGETREDASHMNTTGTVDLPFQYVSSNEELAGRSVNADKEYLIGVGEGGAAFAPLDEWLRARNKKLWEYWPGSSEYRFKGAQEQVRKVGRWIGAAMHKQHVKGTHLGNFMLNSYVGEHGIRFSQIGGSGGSIKQDLLYFQEFIAELEAHDSIKLVTKHGAPQHPHNTALLQITKDLLMHVQNLHTSEELRIISYFICHTPLFWEQQQRHDFCLAFAQFSVKNAGWRTSLNVLLDPQVDPHWATHLSSNLPNFPNLPYTYVQVFNKRHDLYSYTKYGGCSLMYYLRGCHEHLQKYERLCGIPMSSYETIDDTLHRKFPFIIPKTWYYLYESLAAQYNKAALVEELSSQPGLFDYNKL